MNLPWCCRRDPRSSRCSRTAGCQHHEGCPDSACHVRTHHLEQLTDLQPGLDALRGESQDSLNVCEASRRKIVVVHEAMLEVLPARRVLDGEANLLQRNAAVIVGA